MPAPSRPSWTSFELDDLAGRTRSGRPRLAGRQVHVASPRCRCRRSRAPRRGVHQPPRERLVRGAGVDASGRSSAIRRPCALTVEDGGPGRAGRELDRLFDKFYRVPATDAQCERDGHRPGRRSRLGRAPWAARHRRAGATRRPGDRRRPAARRRLPAELAEATRDRPPRPPCSSSRTMTRRARRSCAS